MENTENRNYYQATGKQFVMIIFILALATKMFLLPIFTIRTAGRDGYIALAVGGGTDLILLAAVLVAMMLSKDTDFFTLLKNTLGKIGAKIAAAITGLYLFFKLNVAASEILIFYSDNVFSDFDKKLMTAVFAVFFIAVGLHTLRALCRLNELATPIVVLSIAVLITIVAVTDFDFANIFPSMQNPQDFTKTLVRQPVWLGDFTPAVLFIGKTKLSKKSVTAAAISGLVGTGIAVFFALVMCAAFGNVPSLADSNTNFSNILQFSVGNVYGRIDLLTSVLWSISAFIEAALFFFGAVRCLEFVIGRELHFITSLALCVITYFLQIFIFTDSSIFSVMVSSSATGLTSFALSVFVPVLALVCAIVNRTKTRRKGEFAYST